MTILIFPLRWVAGVPLALGAIVLGLVAMVLHQVVPMEAAIGAMVLAALILRPGRRRSPVDSGIVARSWPR